MAQKVQSQFIETPEIEKRLASCKYGVLSLSDGRSSYGVPLGYCYHEGAVYIGMDIRGRKIADTPGSEPPPRVKHGYNSVDA